MLERVQNSVLYDIYWNLVDPELIPKRDNEEKFYRNLLNGFRPGALIFDVGANYGSKTDVFLRLGAKVLAIEPDESNQAVLQRRFLRYRLSRKPVTVVGKALSDRNSSETMWIESDGSALNTLSDKWAATLREDVARFGEARDFREARQVTTTTLDDLFASFGMPFFVKIDVEGYEVNVLRGMNRPVPYLSFEVNLPEFRAEGLQCISWLSALAPDGQFNFAINCQRGLELEQWLGPKDFTDVFNNCLDTVEVFWKSVK